MFAGWIEGRVSYTERRRKARDHRNRRRHRYIRNKGSKKWASRRRRVPANLLFLFIFNSGTLFLALGEGFFVI